MLIFSAELLFGFARAVGFTLFLPGGFTIFPITARLLVAFIFAVSIHSVDQTQTALNHYNEIKLVLRLFAEMLFGMALTFPLSISIQALQQWGEMLDRARGQQLGASYNGISDSSSGGQTSPLAMLVEYAVIASLYSSGTLAGLVSIYISGVNIYPTAHDLFSTTMLFSVFSTDIMQLVMESLLITFRWFLPIGFLFLLCDLAVGVIGKLVPGLPLFGEMFFVKSLVLFALLLVIFFPNITEISNFFLEEHKSKLIQHLQ